MSAWSSTPKECVDALLRAVEDAAKPRQDNTTVVVVDVLDRGGSKAPPAAATAAPTIRPSEPDPDATQPLDLAEIEAALRAGEQAAIIHREADYDRSQDRARGPLGWIAAVIVLSGVLGGGYFAYTKGYLNTLVSSGASSPVPSSAPSTVEPKPEPPEAPPVTATKPVVKPTPPIESTQPPVEKPQPPKVASGTATKPTPPAADAGKQVRDPLKAGGDVPLMVVVPRGRFKMGSSSISVHVDEGPQHLVELESFAIGKYEVTVAEYAKFAKATGGGMPAKLRATREEHPMTYVTWDDALAYTKWLSAQTGHSYHQPSEAQWEYAARAGSAAPYWWGYEFNNRAAHCFDCDTGLDSRSPTAVGRFDANAFGLHDTSGNVLEWVYDCFHANYQGAPSDGSVHEGGQCQWRVARGGSYSTPSTSLRNAKRSKYKPTGVFDNVGFRVVRVR